MREFRSYGSVRGALSNERPYRELLNDLRFRRCSGHQLNSPKCPLMTHSGSRWRCCRAFSSAFYHVTISPYCAAKLCRGNYVAN
jgi:hypothetical protein